MLWLGLELKVLAEKGKIFELDKAWYCDLGGQSSHGIPQPLKSRKGSFNDKS